MPPTDAAEIEIPPVEDLTTLFYLRIATVLLCALVALALASRPRVAREVFRRYFGAKSGPLNLAIFRILVFSHVLTSARRTRPDDVLAVPVTLRQIAPGWDWLSEGIDLFDPGLVIVAQVTTRIAAGLAIVGLGTRVAAPIAALGAVYLFALPNFFTKINHAGHAAMWCALVLSVSACGDALSLDALVRTGRRKRPRISLQVPASVAYALPLRWCWLLLGVGYFFAGLAKLWSAGDQWLTGQALLARLSVGDGIGFEPILPIHEHPWLMTMTGVGTLAFELGFVVLLLFPRTQLLAAVSGPAFHLGVKYLMGISFMATLKLYVMFIDFERLLGKWAHRLPPIVRENLGLTSPGGTAEGGAARPFPGHAMVMGSALLLGNCYAGYAGIYSWPLSAFPRFEQRVSLTTTNACDNRMVVYEESGKKRIVRSHRVRSPINGPRWRFLLNAILSAPTKQRRRELFVASSILLQNARFDIQSGDHLAIQRVCLTEMDGKRIKTRKTLAKERM